MAVNALERHVALVGFMGAGKSRLVGPLAERLGRAGYDLDQGATEIIRERGIEQFRAEEMQRTLFSLEGRVPSVFALGGGAVTTPEIREELARSAFTLRLDVDVETAWTRSRGSERPLAQDEAEFRRLYAERAPLYDAVADAAAGDLDGAVLACAGVHHELGALAKLGDQVPGTGPVALVADGTVLGLYGQQAKVGLGDRLVSVHELPAGEEAKQIGVLERLWSELTLDRSGTVVALGGGALTDTAGFAAATYLRGIPWVSVPTTLVGQVDAGIGGKTAIDIPQGKNLVGAFHWPARVVIDEAVLETLPEREQRQGQAELIKTELLAGCDLDVRGAAAYKAGICLRDPHDHDVRNWLNLGHTFAHALEAAADFDLAHGEAVALGLLAALRLSDHSTDPVVDALDPQPVRVDRERAWSALQRDKKRSGDQIRLVLLGDDGPHLEVRPAAEVRAALDSLIAD
jgi:3-dehydroquinate synthetase/shikimate kinase